MPYRVEKISTTISDLKVELKRRSLPVSGSKPQLIERLKSFKETIKTTLLDSNKNLSTLENDKLSSNQDSKEKKNEKFDTTKKDLKNDSTLSGNFQDNLIQCRKKIVELHSELNKINSQKYLQSNYSIRSEKLVLQQHLQNKLHHQNLSKQLNHLQQLQQLSDQQSKTQTTRLHLLQTGTNSSSIHDSIITEKKNQKNQNNYETTLQMPTAIVLNLAKPTKLSESILEALVAQVQNQQPVKTSKAETVTSNKYDEAAKLLKVKIEPLKKKTISSQMVDDVLEILISSGELPPTAANEILTTMVPNKNLMPNSNLERDNKDITRSSAVMTDNTPKNFHKKNNINSYSTLSSSDFQQLNTTAELTVSSCSAGSNFKEISNIKRNHLKSEPQSSTFIPAPLVTATTKVPITLQKVQIEKHENQCDLMNETARQLNFELNNQTNTLIESQPRKHFTTDYQHPQEIISPGQPNIDFEVLGEDLNTMDFYQLDCDFEVKMEAQQELMDIVDVSMDMDEANWLETLLPQSSSSLIIPTVTDQTTQNENIFNSSSQKHANLFDPLLSENPDSLDVFNVEFSDFKT